MTSYQRRCDVMTCPLGCLYSMFYPQYLSFKLFYQYGLTVSQEVSSKKDMLPSGGKFCPFRDHVLRRDLVCYNANRKSQKLYKLLPPSAWRGRGWGVGETTRDGITIANPLESWCPGSQILFAFVIRCRSTEQKVRIFFFFFFFFFSLLNATQVIIHDTEAETQNLTTYNPVKHNVWKYTFRYVRPVKTQISLRICVVWPESLLSAWRNIGS